MASSVRSYRANAELSTIISHRISDADVMLALSPKAVLDGVRAEVVSRVADQVMARLAPAIERALAEISINGS